MHRFKDGGVSADVSRRRQTKPAEKAGAHVRDNVTVQVREDHHIEFSGISGELR